MTDEAPVPNDSLGSLFGCAAWLYPRFWTDCALIWAVTCLPGELVLMAVNRAMGLVSPEDIARAARDGALGRVGVHLVVKFSILMGVYLLHHWACIALGNARLGGEENSSKDALRLVISRLRAQVWTMLHFGARLLPICIVAGVAATFTANAPPRTVAAIVALVVLPALYFLTHWTMAPVVTLLEGLSGREALLRSWELSGARFGLFVFHYVVYYVVYLVPSILFGQLSLKVLPAWSAGLVEAALTGLLIAPFGAGMFLALYRRETLRPAPVPDAVAA